MHRDDPVAAPPHWLLWWLFWVLLTNLGFFGGLAAGFGIDALLRPLLHPGVVADTVLAASAALPVGVFLGPLQWLALRRIVQGTLAWIPVTAVGWPVGVAIASGAMFAVFP